MSAPVLLDHPQRHIGPERTANAIDEVLVLLRIQIRPTSGTDTLQTCPVLSTVLKTKLIEKQAVNRWMQRPNARVFMEATADEACLELDVDELGGNAMTEGELHHLRACNDPLPPLCMPAVNLSRHG